MSTILDSLKKSSNKRDGNKQTSIDNFNFSNSNKTSKSGVFMVIILLIITAITLVYGYRYINAQDEPSLETIKNSKALTDNKQKQQDNIASAQMQNTTDQNKSKKLEKPNSESVKQQLAKSIVEAKQPETTEVNKLADKKTNNSDQLNEVKSDATNAAQDIAPKPQRTIINKIGRVKNQNNNISEKTDAEKPMIKLTMPDRTKNQQKPEQKPQVTKQKYMYVYQLPFTVRKEIPKFKLNIHIFDKDPEKRVAVINGTKFAVNDLIEEQVLVKEIIQEGVVLEFNGNIFLVPIL